MKLSPSLLTAAFLFATSIAHAALTDDELTKVDAWLAKPAAERPPVGSLELARPLDRDQAKEVTKQLWERVVAAHPASQSPLGPLPDVVGKPERGKPLAIRGGELPLGEHVMPFAVIRREVKDPPTGGRALYICLHGGGQNAEAEGPHSWPVNNSEFQAQVGLSVQLYPGDGIYWIPRMADDRLGRWWNDFNQQAFDQVIDHAVMHWGVDPNRVYLLGISEGGYGTDILGPYMADRWASCSAMAAGVGLDNPPENLRNVAFRTDVGEKDTMFDRQKFAVAYHERLDALHKQDDKGYINSIDVQKGKGHGVDYKLGPAWMIEHTRTAWPDRVVWIDKPLDKTRRDRFYWVVAPAGREGRNKFVATIDRAANRVDLTAQRLVADEVDAHPTHIQPPTIKETLPFAGGELTLLLDDELVDFARPLQVAINEGEPQVFELSRTAADILQSLAERPDATTAAPCRLHLLPK